MAPKLSRQEIARQKAAASLDEREEEDDDAFGDEFEEDTRSKKNVRRGSGQDDVGTKRPRGEPTATSLFTPPVLREDASPRSNSGRSGDGSSSSSDSAEDAFEKCYSQVQTFPKCKVTTELIIDTKLTYKDLLIGVEGANFVLRNLNGLSRYHYTLEYERFLININQKDIRLDKHIYIYIHYLLYLLSEEGLEGVQLLTKARAHLTTDGFFVEGRSVLSKNLVYAIEFKKEFYKYLIRIADSYYTKIFRKCKRVMSEVIKIFEFVVPECGYISREVYFYFFNHFNY